MEKKYFQQGVGVRSTIDLKPNIDIPEDASVIIYVHNDIIFILVAEEGSEAEHMLLSLPDIDIIGYTMYNNAIKFVNTIKSDVNFNSLIDADDYISALQKAFITI